MISVAREPGAEPMRFAAIIGVNPGMGHITPLPAPPGLRASRAAP